MKKIVITGGDNCYCCECGGRCDKLAMIEDSEKKELRYIDGFCDCTGKYCWRFKTLADGTVLENWRGKITATKDGESVPIVCRAGKWGKDGDYGSRGSSFFTTKEECERARAGEPLPLRREVKEWDYNDDRDFADKIADYTELTGWTLCRAIV